MAFPLLLLGACAQASTPTEDLRGAEPGEVRVSANWAYGCDNTLRCHAVSLAGHEEGDWDGSLQLLIELPAPGEKGEAMLQVVPSAGMDDFAEEAEFHPQDVVAFRIHGKRFTLDDIDEDMGSETPLVRFILPDDAARAMAGAREIELLTAKGESAGFVQTRLLGDVLEHFRTIWENARPHPLPVLDHPAPPLFDPQAESFFSAEMAVEWQRKAGCPELEAQLEIRPLAYRIAPLDRTHSLALVSCAGAWGDDQETSWFIPLLLTEGKASPAQFAGLPWQPSIATLPLLPDSWLEDETGILHSFATMRTLGDCGERRDYVWQPETARFELVRIEEMPTCRGAGEWIRTYYRPSSMEIRD
ncbi:MAG: DUF1176 domain-containing protein [Sphingomonadaceae bacterium]|nr:DUF1176 domain-containing protein [Sphingomonadaceae bacterium]